MRRVRDGARPAYLSSTAAIVAVTALLVPAFGSRPAPAGAAVVGQYFKVDPHAHSVLSGDSVQDLGIMAAATRARGFDAIFVTDHTATGNASIGGVIANHVTYADSAAQWTSATTGSPSLAVAQDVASPVHGGAASFRVAATSSTSGESFAWIKRGPNFRSGTITLRFSVFPKTISPASGLYVSASIGGDATIASRQPDGYTTAGGVISPGKSTVFVWQLGNARQASTDPNARVITYNMPYTLNQWNTYTVNVTQALNDIPAADRPLDYNALQYIKMTARATNGGSAEGFFDDLGIDAVGIGSGQEFVDRNRLIGSYDTATYQQFPSQEVGYSDHANQFNFNITDPSQFVVNKRGSLAIPSIQATGYPAQLNHPAFPGGVTEQEAVDTAAYGAELMETVPRGGDTSMIRVWDEIMQQTGRPLIGTWTSDAHRTASFGPATYLYAPARGFDPFMRAMFEGRTYLANDNFAGRVELKIDDAAGPYPSRYPVFVGSGTPSISPTLGVTGGLVPGDRVVWIRNGVVEATDGVSGASFSKSRVFALSGGTNYVRVEIRDSSGTIKAMTEPIFVKSIAAIPMGLNLHTQGVTTASGRGYTNALVKGITDATWNSTTNTATYSLDDSPGSLVEMRGSTGPYDVSGVSVDGGVAPQAATMADYESATSSAWYFDQVGRALLVKARHAATASSVNVQIANASDTEPPTAPGNLQGIAESSERVRLTWDASTDNTGVAQYRVRRDGVVLSNVPAAQLTYVDTSVVAGTTYVYSVEAIDGVGLISPPATVTVRSPSPQTTVVTTIADSYVSSDTPSTNYGSSTALRIDGSPTVNTYLRFSIPPSLGVVVSARLELYGNASGTSGYRAHTTSGSWTESGVTFTNAPMMSAPLRTSLAVVAGQWNAVDVTGIVPTSGQLDLGITTAGTQAISFSSRQGANAPRIILTTSAATLQANDVSASGPEDSLIQWTPSVYDPNTATLTCSLLSVPGVGTATIAPDCKSGTYVPPPNYSGTQSFVYAMTNGSDQRQAAVTITVIPVNDPPAMDDDQGNPAVVEDTPAQLSFSATDPDGTCPLEFVVLAPPAHASLSAAQVSCIDGHATADITYRPNTNYFGSDSFSVQFRDPVGATSAALQANIYVTPIQDPPIAQGASLTTKADTTVRWTPTVSDPDGDTLVCTIEAPPLHGVATIASNCSTAAYTPATAYTGADSVRFRVSDGIATASAVVSVSIRSKPGKH